MLVFTIFVYYTIDSKMGKERGNEFMPKEILHRGKRLLLRRAVESDLDFILRLEYDPENVSFIVPFDRTFHEPILRGEVRGTMDIIVEECATGEPVGYVLANGLQSVAKEIEWTHIIVAKKGLGYGHETLKLLKAWAFEDLQFHRAWLDCKPYNRRALHLYKSEGMVLEGRFRETIVTNGVYEDLVVLALLAREYEAMKQAGIELESPQQKA